MNWFGTKNIKVPGIRTPISLRKKTSDYAVFCQLFLYQQYNLNINFQPRTIIDAGANIGLASLQFKNRFPESKIIAIEPDKSNFIQLQQNLSDYSDIYFKQAALWNKKTYLNISDKHNSGEWGFITEESENYTEDSVEAIGVSDIFREYEINILDILKVDIETAEKQVFAQDYQDWLPNVKILMIELHDKLEKGTAMSFFKAVTSSLKNFSYYQIGETSIVVNEDLLVA